MRTIVTFTKKIYSEKGGGINTAILDRSRLFRETNNEMYILTFGEYDYKSEENALYNSGKLSKSAKHINLFGYYSEKNTIDKETNAPNYLSSIIEKNYKLKEESNKNTYYIKEKFDKIEIYKKNNKYHDIHYFDDNKVVISEKLNPENIVFKRSFYDSENRVVKVEHLTTDGFCFLKMKLNEQTNKKYYCLYYRNNGKSFKFNKLNDLYTHWLTEFCSSMKQKPYIISDKKQYASIVLNVEKKVAYKVFFIHLNHKKNLNTEKETVKAGEGFILSNLSNIDALIVLTEDQKKDILAEYDCKEKIHVIPHHINENDFIKAKKKNKLKKQVSIVSRLVPDKQIDQAIKAFSNVVLFHPDAQLNIYGIGNSEKYLEQKIKKIGLQKNVFLKGFSNDINHVLNESVLSLMTSKSEAFSLVILESMKNGTPVISYDIKYGPNDLITNNKDGFLIPEDTAMLEKKLIKLLRKPKFLIKTGKKAQKKVLREYNEKKVIKKWEYLFRKISK